MNGAVIYAKTRKGLEELTHRTAAVPQKVRSILILVDGKTRCSELLQKCSFISECKEHLEWLEEHRKCKPITEFKAEQVVCFGFSVDYRIGLTSVARTCRREQPDKS